MSAKLKAASPIHTIDFAKQMLGPMRYAALVETMPSETRAMLERSLVAVEWIPADEWLPFQKAILEQAFEGDEARFREFCHRVAEKDFRTLHKMMLRLASPVFVLERLEKLWRSYSDSGTLVAKDVVRGDDQTRLRLVLDGFVCSYDVMGVLVHAFVEKILLLTGAKQVSVTRRRNDIVGGKLSTELEVVFA